MNLPAIAPQWLVALLFAMLIAAAVEDAFRLRISNLTCIGIFLAGIAAIAIAGPERALWQNLVVFIAILAVGTPLFTAGKMGGGDIKLLAVTGLWFDLQGALLLLVCVLIAGGLLAMFLIGVRRSLWSAQAAPGAKVLKRGGVIPYGVAISAGAIFSIALAVSR
jgi:prepilin peptidase CpaA